MEVIKKHISFEPVTGRLGTKIVPYNYSDNPGYFDDYETDWGIFPSDIKFYNNDGGESELSLMEDYMAYEYSGQVITYHNLADVLRLSTNTNGETVLRYSDICWLYSYIKKYMRGCDMYRLCMRGSELIWSQMTDFMWDRMDFPEDVKKNDIEYPIAKFFTDGMYLTDVIPSESETLYYNIGDIICVNSDFDNYSEIFLSSDTRVRYDHVLYNFVEDLINNDYRELDIFSEPFMTIPVLLNGEGFAVGTYTADIEKWVPNKRYYIGNKVWYSNESQENGNLYELIYEKDLESTYGEDVIEVPYGVYNGLKDYASEDNGSRVYESVESGVTRYYYGKKYFKGYFDSASRVTRFDEVGDDGEYIHWKKSIDGDIETKDVYAYGDSMLKLFERVKKSFDDYGNQTPFNIHYVDTAMTETSVYGELRYMLGKADITDVGGKRYADIMTDIVIYNADGEEVRRFEYDSMDDDVIKTLGDIVTGYDGSATGITEYYNDNIDTLGEYIEFVYYDNVEIDSDGAMIPDTGILHKEMYHFTVSEYTGYISECTGEYVWAEIEDTGSILDTETTKVDVLPDPSIEEYGKIYKNNELYYTSVPIICYMDIDTSVMYMYGETGVDESGNTIYGYYTEDGAKSLIYYPGQLIVGDDFQNATLFSEGGVIGASEINANINVNIDRGSSAAWERHNILGEVNSFDDLENYRNGYFGLS